MTRTLLLLAVTTAWLSAHPHWIATWSAGLAPPLTEEAQMRSANLVFDDQTLRQIVHTSSGGDAVRVRLSNLYGRNAVQISSAYIALRMSGSSVDPLSNRSLTFGGRVSATIPPNATIISDPVGLEVPADADLAISLYLPRPTSGAGIHYSALQTNFIGPGDQTANAGFNGGATLNTWVFLAGVDVAPADFHRTVVAFGDSITDGTNSTLGGNRRWPNLLAQRLRDAGHKTAVVNAGIAGNRLLQDPAFNVRFGANALARYERDILGHPGVRYAIVMEGINDLGMQPASTPPPEAVTAEDIIGALTQIANRLHEMRLKVFVGTLTPFANARVGGFPTYFTPEKELIRKAVNDWIRSGAVFDAFIDFDLALRDPRQPEQLLPDYDSGDHLHPSDAGYKAMADTVDLSLFR